MPNARYLQLLDEMRELHERKSQGYGREDDTWDNFRDAGRWGSSALTGCLIRLGDKYRRAQNLFNNPDIDDGNESLTDTLKDLAAYALISVCLLEEVPND